MVEGYSAIMVEGSSCVTLVSLFNAKEEKVLC